MADFNVDMGGAPTGARPVQAVEDNSTAVGLNLLGNLFANTGSAVKSAIVAGNNKEIADANQHVLGSIQQNLLLKNDLVDQGWDSARARRAVRRQLATDLANHPGLSKEITQLYKDTLAKGGLGGNILEGTQAENDAHALQVKAVDRAQSLGLWPQGLDPNSEQGQATLRAVQQYDLHATQLKQAADDLDFKRKQVGYQTDVVQLASAKQSYVTGGITQQTARLNLAEKQAEVQSRAAITGGAAAYNKLLSGKLAETWADFKSGKITADEASLQMDQDSAQVIGLANQSAPDAGGEYVRNALSPTLGLVDSFKEALTGKKTADQLQNELDSNVTRMALMQIHNNPEVLPIIAASKVLNGIPPAVVSKMTSDGFKMIGFNVDTGKYDGASNVNSILGNKPALNTPKPKLPNFTGSDADTKAALAYTKAGIESVLSGTTADKGSVDEVNNTLKTVIKSSVKYGKTVDDAKDLDNLVNLFASSSFGTYIKSGKFTANAEDISSLTEALDSHYRKQLVPLMRQEFVNSKTYAGFDVKKTPTAQPTQVATPALIHTEFDGNGIKFIPADPTSVTDATRVQISQLNKNVAPVFNKTIKAYSNLKGDTLENEYNLLISDIMPPENTQEPEQP